MSGWTGYFPNLEVMLAAEEDARRRGPHFDFAAGEAGAVVISDRDEFAARFTTDQLVAIVTGAVDIKQLAHDELVSRGIATPCA